MPSLDDDLRKRLIAKFGTSVNLEAGTPVVRELLAEIAAELAEGDNPPSPNYNKSYTEGYNKEGYMRADYNRYDKTYEKTELIGYVDPQILVAELGPELERLISSILVERLRRSGGEAIQGGED
jgi:hypothetical protein